MGDPEGSWFGGRPIVTRLSFAAFHTVKRMMVPSCDPGTDTPSMSDIYVRISYAKALSLNKGSLAKRGSTSFSIGFVD